MTPLLSVSGNDYPQHDTSDFQHVDACLEPLQLIQLEWSFRQWVRITNRYETRLARHRMLMFFLLIRYAGAALHEVLSRGLHITHECYLNQ